MNQNESVGEKAEPPAEPHNYLSAPAFGTAGHAILIFTRGLSETVITHGISAIHQTFGFNMQSVAPRCRHHFCAVMPISAL